MPNVEDFYHPWQMDTLPSELLAVTSECLGGALGNSENTEVGHFSLYHLNSSDQIKIDNIWGRGRKPE